MAQSWSERQKAQGKRLVLTFWRDRWKKKIDGKTEYFSGANSAEGYEAAVLEYAKFVKSQNPEPEAYEYDDAPFLPGMFPSRKTQLRGLLDDPAMEAAALSIINGGDAKPACQTIGSEIDRFLSIKRKQAEADAKSFATVKGLEDHLARVEKCLGTGLPMKAIGTQQTNDLYNWLNENVRGNRSREMTFKAYKQLLNWSATQDESELPALPLNLKRPEFTFAKSRKPTVAKMFTRAELRAMVEVLNPKWRAMVLVAVNCGMTQVDLGSLTGSQFDWRKGRLIHRRIKTRRNEWTPLVRVDQVRSAPLQYPCAPL